MQEMAKNVASKDAKDNMEVRKTTRRQLQNYLNQVPKSIPKLINKEFPCQFKA
jgi:hypothetical protein